MTDKLTIGAEISTSITVRGQSVDEQYALTAAKSPLDAWQAGKAELLPDGAKFEASDAFSAKPQGEYSVKRTLKVVEEDNAGSEEAEAEDQHEPEDQAEGGIAG